MLAGELEPSHPGHCCASFPQEQVTQCGRQDGLRKSGTKVGQGWNWAGRGEDWMWEAAGRVDPATMACTGVIIHSLSPFFLPTCTSKIGGASEETHCRLGDLRDLNPSKASCCPHPPPRSRRYSTLWQLFGVAPLAGGGDRIGPLTVQSCQWSHYS